MAIPALPMVFTLAYKFVLIKTLAFAVLINGVAPAALEAIQNDLIKEYLVLSHPWSQRLIISKPLTPSKLGSWPIRVHG